MKSMRWPAGLAVTLVAMMLLGGGLALDRADRTIACLAQTNAELARVNSQLHVANQHIAEMHLKLADTSRKLDETNANLALTNNKIVSIDQVFQRFGLRK
jgi:hypothetical protein